MRLIYILALLLLSGAATAAPPTFTVENKIAPSIVVTNKIPATLKTTCGCATTGKCTCWEGQCACAACREVKPAKATPSSGLRYNASHTCPNCGRTSPAGTGSWIVRGYTTGGHIHQCPDCGTRWFH